jgi:hypothetical protein
VKLGYADRAYQERIPPVTGVVVISGRDFSISPELQVSEGTGGCGEDESVSF